MFYSTILSLLSLVSCRPGGAPKCGINEAAIQAGMGSPKEALGYALSVVPAGNNMWNISVKNPKLLDYQGILMYVHQVNKPQVHLGSITFANAKKWKYQPKALCDAGGIISSSTGTVTHANPDKVQIAKNVIFQWTASAPELALEGLVVNAVVATTQGSPNAFAKWQHLDFIGIPPTVISSGSPSPPGTGPNTSADPNASTTQNGASNSTASASNSTTQTATNSTSPTSVQHIVTVGAGGLVYSPATLNVNVGDTIVWNYSAPHSVTQSSLQDDCTPMAGGFDSGTLSTGSYTQTISPAQAGSTLFYYCSVGQHCQNGMKGSITVAGTSASPDAPALSSSISNTAYLSLSFLALLASVI